MKKGVSGGIINAWVLQPKDKLWKFAITKPMDYST
jgi:hypothetical protein